LSTALSIIHSVLAAPYTAITYVIVHELHVLTLWCSCAHYRCWCRGRWTS